MPSERLVTRLEPCSTPKSGPVTFCLACCWRVSQRTSPQGRWLRSGSRSSASGRRILGAGEVGVAGQITIATEAKTVLVLSLRESLSLGHSYIGTEHLLLALLRQPEGDGARILTDLGADRRRFATR